MIETGGDRLPPTNNGWNSGLAPQVVSPALGRVVGEEDSTRDIDAGDKRLPPARDGWNGCLAVVDASPALSGMIDEEDATHVCVSSGDRLPQTSDRWNGVSAVTVVSPAPHRAVGEATRVIIAQCQLLEICATQCTALLTVHQKRKAKGSRLENAP